MFIRSLYVLVTTSMCVFPHVTISATQDLDQIFVSASRSLIQKKESASSVTVINENKINRRQVPFVSSLLRDIPGAAVSQSGSAGAFTQLRLRGAEANHTLVVIDGIEANDPSLGSEFNFAHLLSCGLERVEVLRGPQSSLWGSDALAGVVNIETKKGDGPTKIESSFSGGDRETLQNCTGIHGSTERTHYSAFGSFYDTEGNNVSSFGSEKDGYDNQTLSFRQGISFNQYFEIDMAGRSVDATSEFDPGSPPSDGDEESDISQNYLRATGLLHLLDGKWAHRVGIALTDTKRENFSDGTETNSTEGEKFKLDYQTNLFFNTSAITNMDHVVTLAVEHEEEEFKQTGMPSFFGDPNQNQGIINIGYVGEYRVSFEEQLFLSASIRHDDNDEFEDRSTHRFSIAYSPQHYETKIHLAYATGVKNPTFTERFGFTPDTFVGNPDLKPEKSKGWEIGLSHSFSDRLGFDATYFSEELEDEINGFFFDAGLSGFTAINLDGISDRKGVELSFWAQLFKSLDLKGSYTYVDAKEPDETGKLREIRRPKNVASLISNYRFLGDKANLNLRINYIDEQLDNDFSTFPAQRIELDDYTLVSLAGEYRLNKWVVLQGRIENLFNEKYQDAFGFETQEFNAHAGIKFLLGI